MSLVTCKSADGVGVLVGVLVGVQVAVLVGVFVAVLVLVGVFVGVAVGVLVGVNVAVLVGVFVGVAVRATTVVLAEAELLFRLGSYVSLDTPAVVLIIVPGGVPGFTLNVTEKLTLAPEARLKAVQLTMPVPPVDGVVQIHPGGTAIP